MMKQGIEAWLPDKDSGPFYGVDRTAETQFDRPAHLNYIPPIWENVKDWLRFRINPTMYYSPSMTPWRNVQLRLRRWRLRDEKEMD
ncbi:MAG: hypothetical protein ACXABY_07905 [Candidatus Thorarchaeota archaeon]